MATRTTEVTYCAHCAQGHHLACIGNGCQCGERAHDPDVETAAAMRRYQRPDLVAVAPEILATQWRQVTSRVVS